jgi:hypothetical protein
MRTIGLVHPHRPLPPVAREFLAFAKEQDQITGKATPGRN